VNERLLAYYEEELRHLREMGGEFAMAFPKVASRLGLDAFACADPYVERLLEGFSFLSARVRLEIDAQFPRFTQHLADMIYPGLLAPTPSMAVVEFEPDRTHPALARGLPVPRGTALMSRLGRAVTTRCEFRTAHALTLLPWRLTQASYRPFDCLPAGLDCRLSHTPKATLTLRLEWDRGARPDASRLDRLSLHLRGAQGLAERLYMRMTGHVCGGYVRLGDRRDGRCVPLAPRCVVAKGFDDAEALLPVSGGSYRGCRLLREYFACPARFSFVEILDLRLAIASASASASAPALESLDIVLLLDAFDESLMTSVDRSSFALHCTPAINLFAKRADRVTVDDRRFEHHVVVDRTRPLDHEVFSVEGIEGYVTAHAQPQRFAPFYRARDAGPGERATGYFQARRTPRVISGSSASNAHYAGSEVFVALVDPSEAPYAANVRQLGIDVLCTHRHLPLSMPVGEGDTDFTAGADLPAIERIRCIVGPSAPRPPLAEQAGLWRLLDMLSASRLPLMERADADGDRAAQCDAQALRQWLSTLCPPGDEAGRRQIALLRQANMRTITRRLPLPGPVCFGRGLEVTLSFDDAAWAGAHASVFSAVLARALADYLPINQFAETVVRTPTHGVVARYPAQVGRCEIL
jgi:type VI secretion system protein ImpG